ncbi:hypothetical protein PUN28_011757 [Cardiocondyla obscurior]|uniref:Uncharacterized protein n=1 Tax=Cardiocondyla obscurior TaxID=286306 RepID=A0AAW2FGX0_9HYME
MADDSSSRPGARVTLNCQFLRLAPGPTRRIFFNAALNHGESYDGHFTYGIIYRGRRTRESRTFSQPPIRSNEKEKKKGLNKSFKFFFLRDSSNCRFAACR